MHATKEDGAGTGDAVRIVLRPLGSALPLGFLVFGTGMAVLGGIQLHLIPLPMTHQAAVLLLTFVAPLEFVASLLAFVSRDGLAGTGLGLFAGSWATIGVQYLLAQPGARSPVQAIYFFTFAVAVVLLGVVALKGQLLLAVILLSAAVRTALSALYELLGIGALQTTSGIISLAITALALYGGLALLLEDTTHGTVLPLARRGQSRTALEGSLGDQLGDLQQEAGIRRNL
ncbi:GPR1/FUN34/YaaH family transporter [Blastococcus atacamensis]|uniref:GPR1/FUN34/YaaH family transporter n=1 Tax=Blastococcus atacamensis TaxID=2070508 RepID=UPI0012FFE114|nr:GPR1/FUN34/YaaH family transporter [Blastococcus atacamensis]